MSLDSTKSHNSQSPELIEDKWKAVQRVMLELRVIKRKEDITKEVTSRRNQSTYQNLSASSPPTLGSPTLPVDKKTSLSGLVFEGMTFDPNESQQFLSDHEFKDCFFVNCTGLNEEELLKQGAIILHLDTSDLPLKPLRSSMYELSELTSIPPGSTIPIDTQIYQWSKNFRGGSQRGHIAAYLHDGCILDALLKSTSGRNIVGIMGGHGMFAISSLFSSYYDLLVKKHRADPSYRQIVHLCYDLAKAGMTVITGGGPGAMEGANLGAFLVNHPPNDVEEAINMLSTASNEGFENEYQNYPPADKVLAKFKQPGDGDLSIGVPTFWYGHEPSNRFCGKLAKFISNAIREDVLISMCNNGIVFCPGSAGTRTEIFQQAVLNSYAKETPEFYSKPMIFLNRNFWLSNGLFATLLNVAQREDADTGKTNGWSKRIWCLDDNDEIVSSLSGFSRERHGIQVTNPHEQQQQVTTTVLDASNLAVDNAIKTGHIHNGSIIGIGSGLGPSLALNHIFSQVKTRGWQVSCVPCSDSSFAVIAKISKASSGSIIQASFVDNSKQDIAFIEGSASEISANSSVIGSAAAEEGCLFAESILVQSSDYVVAIMRPNSPKTLKESASISLGVLPYAINRAKETLCKLIQGINPTLKNLIGGKSTPHITDTGCIVLDVQSLPLFASCNNDVSKVVNLLKSIPGVIETSIHTNISEVYF